MQKNQPQEMDARDLLPQLQAGSVAAAFFDPQYRGVLDHLGYGNEGERQQGRAELAQMDESTIAEIVGGIAAALRPSGHLFLWVDVFHLCEGVGAWLPADLHRVGLLTWDKGVMGMGYRLRSQAEYLLVYQKAPKRAKGVWTDRGIRNVWGPVEEAKALARLPGLKVESDHPHKKPPGLIGRLIGAVTSPGDLVLDPSAGSYVVLDAALSQGRDFVGCDLRPRA